jgi:hypothetical protein
MVVRYRWNHTERKLALYALVDPVSPPSGAAVRRQKDLVEAPGTAPGSDGFITTAIYRHSRPKPALMNIGNYRYQKQSPRCISALESELMGHGPAMRPGEIDISPG